jgi:DNA polymerase (family 10)
MSELANGAIADALDELGDLYELDGAVVHRVLAYRNAARTIRNAPVSVAKLAREGQLQSLPGIGATLEQKILALLASGEIPAAAKLRERYPRELLSIMALPGVGAKRTRRLFDELGISSPAQLREAAAAGRVRTLKGFGPRGEAAILAALDGGAAERPLRRLLLDRALEIGDLLLGALAEARPGAQIELAGSARRRTETVKDIDIVVDDASLLDALASLAPIESAARTGASAARGRSHDGTTVELRAVAPAQFGNLLQHLTGSNAHNAALRQRAVRGGLHISEYGVLEEATGLTHHMASEAELYELAGLSFIEPELRENRGELDAAAEGTLPRLLERSDLRGDLHAHTTASDGRAEIEEMALAARALGYEYLAITDHSATHGFGDSVSPDQLRRQIELVREADARIEGIRLLAGSEVNILPDGSLDYDDALLAELDWVIASVHTAFATAREAMTERLCRAARHPLVDAIGHPTGRRIERRAPYELDLEALFTTCSQSATMLEINSNPDRRDLSEVNARAAAAAGVTLLVNSDAHSTAAFEAIRYGVWTARRAWLTPAEVANTLPWDELRRRLKRQRSASA